MRTAAGALLVAALPLLPLAAADPGPGWGTHQGGPWEGGSPQVAGLGDLLDGEKDASSGATYAPDGLSWGVAIAVPLLGAAALAAWTVRSRRYEDPDSPRSGGGPGEGGPDTDTDREEGAATGETPSRRAEEGDEGVQEESEALPEAGDLLGEAGDLPASGGLPGSPDPADAEPGIPRLLRLGQEAVDRGEIEEAVEWFETAVAADPDLAVAHLCRGLTLEEVDRHGEAAEAFREAVDADPGNPAARYLLARTLAGAGEPREAIVHLRQVLDVVPQLEDVARHDEGFAALRDDPRFLAALGDL